MVAGVIVGVGATRLVGLLLWRWRRLAAARAVPPVRGALYPLRGMARAAQPLPPPRPVIEHPAEVHLHLHGISAADVAAIIEQHRPERLNTAPAREHDEGMRTPYRRCPCCGLEQPPAMEATGVMARVCGYCTDHQDDARRLARAETHERLLRERLGACRASESRAQLDARRAHEAASSALHSRRLLAARLVDAAGESGDHRCAAMGIARDPQVIQWAQQGEGDTQFYRPARLRPLAPRSAWRRGRCRNLALQGRPTRNDRGHQ
jgi:hypothetical protein